MKATEFTSLSDYARKQTEEKWMSIPQTAQMSTMHSNKVYSPRQRRPLDLDLQLIPPAEQKDYSFFNSMQDSAANSVASVVGMIPKLVKDLAEAEKAVNKELEEQGNARGSQELTIFDRDDD